MSRTSIIINHIIIIMTSIYGSRIISNHGNPKTIVTTHAFTPTPWKGNGVRMRSGVLIFLGGVGMEELTKITEARNYNTRKQHFFGSRVVPIAI
jgi:hypothetical protein